VSETLSSNARSIAATNLAIAHECSELKEIFARANAPLLFVKGLTVAALAYRNPMVKMGWDIDLLIEERDLAAAARLLSQRGYALHLPASVAELQPWHARSKESVWHKNGNLYVELHTRLADNRRLIPDIDVHSPRQVVQVGPSVSLPTLAGDELFSYLAVHGASSAWFRLKWISDVAAILAGQSGDRIRQIYDRSQSLGAGRAAGQALLLADRLFATLDPIPDLREELMADARTRMLCDAATRMLTERDRDPDEQLLGTLSIHWTQFFLQPGWAYKLSEMRNQWQSLVRRIRH
jgi:putative nucleotidyltransferase-like protein